MFKKIKQYSVTLAAALMLAVPTLTPVVAHAADNAVANGACSGANTAFTGEGTDTSGNTVSGNCNATTDDANLNKLIRDVINIFSIIVGAISVLMIIYGGFRYITSSGDSGKVTNAKKTIMYALIGLAIVGLSQLIVYFVLTKSTEVVL